MDSAVAVKGRVSGPRNALSYRTEYGAQVGDLFMSLIHTCELNCVNLFDYLVELLRHAAQVVASPRRVDAVVLPGCPLAGVSFFTMPARGSRRDARLPKAHEAPTFDPEPASCCATACGRVQTHRFE
jgi:hypothetical protein